MLNLKTVKNREDFVKIAKAVTNLPYNYIRSISTEELKNLFIQNCLQGIENNHHFLVVEKDSQVMGFASILKSDWDSKFFNKNIHQVRNLWIQNNDTEVFKIVMKEIYSYCSKNKTDTIQINLQYETPFLVQLLEREGFFTTDVHCTYFIDFEKTSINNMDYGNIVLREFVDSDSEYLLQIARTSYNQDRYHLDPFLPNKLCDSFYESWISNSFSGEIADFTVVAELNKIPVGFMTIKYYYNFNNIFSDNIGTLLLSAVSSAARENGIYSSMIHFCMNWLKERNCRYIHFGSQVYNIPVQRTWIGLGFKIGEVNTWLNKWF